MSACPKCQQPLGPEAQECTRCGVILAKARAHPRSSSTEADRSSTPPWSSETSNDSRSRARPLLLTAFLLVLVGFAGITNLLIGRKSEITDKFFEGEMPVTETITERIIEQEPTVIERADEELRQGSVFPA